MPLPNPARALLAAAALLAARVPLAAQTPVPAAPDSAPAAEGASACPVAWGPGGGGGLVMLGSTAEDRLRVLQLLGCAPTGGFLLRTPSTLGEEARGGPPAAMRLEIVAPRVETVYNSALPFSRNDGALWAGRGANLQATAGVAARSRRLTLVVAPQLVFSENRDFDLINGTRPDRSPFASPWHQSPESADLPLRFGTERLLRMVPGQSVLSVSAGPVAVGASTENQWWGPGIRNAILLSSNAEGVPRLFARTARPLRTGVGSFRAEWMAGALSESRFFDTIPENDTRSLSALAVTFTPAGEPGLTLGLARAVYAPASGWGGALGNALDVFTDVGRPNALPVTDSARVAGPDEILSLFGRWVVPASGVEVYAEWARHERPASLRDLLEAPNHTQGYTVGLQWARPVRGSALRLQAEATNLEQSATYRQRRVASYYTSRPVLQGYTQRGQVLGAAIGPGASGQWIAADWMAPRWSAGLFGGRVRWENDTHYTLRPPETFLDVGHDVSLLGGARGSLRVGPAEVTAEYTWAMRYNYLFQYLTDTFENPRGMDVSNHTLRLTFAPAGGA